jgi:hypothetical protein
VLSLNAITRPASSADSPNTFLKNGECAHRCDHYGESATSAAEKQLPRSSLAVRDSGCDAARTGLTLENKGISVLRPSMDGLTLVVALSLSF